ncbi:hypothetical protein N172_07530 [Pantoea dispersa EGD-AAK13]|nr:hypothetical protein N172_07530 [Pantoea dispersa EGD-AAK13]KAF0855994.1 hypothetical protein Y788_05805 [Pantoea dispersa 625]
MKSQVQGELMYGWLCLNWLVSKLNYYNIIILSSQQNLQHLISQATLTLLLQLKILIHC